LHWNTKETALSLLWHTAFFKMLADIIPCCKNGSQIMCYITIFDHAGEKEKTGTKIVPGSFWKSGSIPLPFMSL